jgi:hypothetical protein
MRPRVLRNIAFAGMVVGAVSFFGVGTYGNEAECTCCLCDGPIGDCYQVGPDVQGWTHCNDAGSSCGVYGSVCTGKPD